jgi:hypothetical protein
VRLLESLLVILDAVVAGDIVEAERLLSEFKSDLRWRLPPRIDPDTRRQVRSVQLMARLSAQRDSSLEQ